MPSFLLSAPLYRNITNNSKCISQSAVSLGAAVFFFLLLVVFLLLLVTRACAEEVPRTGMGKGWEGGPFRRSPPCHPAVYKSHVFSLSCYSLMLFFFLIFSGSVYYCQYCVNYDCKVFRVANSRKPTGVLISDQSDRLIQI